MKRWIASLVAVVLLLGTIPVAMAESDVFYTTKKVKMYAEMSVESDILCEIPMGKKVQSFETLLGSKWANVAWDGYYGYVPWKYLSQKKPTPKPTAKPTPKPTKKPAPTPKPTPKVHLSDFDPVDYYANVTLENASSRMNMRWMPTTDSDVVGVYAHGDLMHVLMEGGTWAQVMDPNSNRVGYMKLKYLTETDAPVFGAEEDQSEAESEMVVSPMNAMESLESLQAALPNLALRDAPEGATNVTYNWINTKPVIAQIEFELDGVAHTLRAAECASEEDQVSIDGIYAEMHEEAEDEGMHLCTDDNGEFAVVHYYSDTAKAQYSLASAAQPDGGERLIALARELFPAE